MASGNSLTDLRFPPAWGPGSTPKDWLWGKLHRLVLEHPMGGPFSVPPAFGELPSPFSDLPGLPTDGGFGTVDAANHDPRGLGAEGYLFSRGPSNRMVTELTRGPMKRSESAWPGGVSAVPGSPGYLNLLPLWLTNDTVRLRTTAWELLWDTTTVERFAP
jgi:penicillin amidase